MMSITKLISITKSICSQISIHALSDTNWIFNGKVTKNEKRENLEKRKSHHPTVMC